ncbi:hypothetical protein L917_12173 [Phytophthora nicotianae]|uniref:Uncharacterized protein n=1 Tax=Phytophthora nicotianae TaxID=4792 RepID=W2KUJ4_PHYNI|nr:hypothetical protein L917_12173 [Phytophthora nicotianae]
MTFNCSQSRWFKITTFPLIVNDRTAIPESQNAIEEVPQRLLADEGCDMDIDDVGIDFA